MFQFQQATRHGIKPLIALYGESNSGKTYSALLMARGFAGKNGKIILGDTESGRGALYADIIPGGYLRADIEPPFSPQRFIQFLDEAEKAGADAIVIDSLSHEHEGDGGVLDMAMANEAKSGRAGLHNWKGPKMEHAKLVLRLVRSRTFVIVCLRAKFKTRQVKDASGRTQIVKDDHVSPIQDEALLFEMTAHAEMQPADPGTFRLTKWSVPDLAKCFPQSGKLAESTGTAIRTWSEGGKAGKPQAQEPEPKQDLELKSPSKRMENFMRYVDDIDDPEKLTMIAGNYKNEVDQDEWNEVRTHIMARATSLGLVWDKEHKAFV
jgi:hypothetical protein